MMSVCVCVCIAMAICLLIGMAFVPLLNNGPCGWFLVRRRLKNYMFKDGIQCHLACEGYL